MTSRYISIACLLYHIYIYRVGIYQELLVKFSYNPYEILTYKITLVCYQLSWLVVATTIMRLFVFKNVSYYILFLSLLSLETFIFQI